MHFFGSPESYLKDYLFRSSRKRSYAKSHGFNYIEGWEEKQRYLFFTFQLDKLTNESIKNDLVPIFITLTLPSEYHILGCKKNVSYASKSIREGYVKLQSIFRTLYKNFRVNRDYVSVKYAKVIEPHKSMIPHLHSLLYVPSCFVEKFKIHFFNIVKNNKLEQVDFKVLDKANYANVYLLKYIKKTITEKWVRGWSLVNRIRQFTISKITWINFEDYRNLSKYIKYDSSSPLDYLSQIEDKVSVKKELFDSSNNLLKTFDVSVSNSYFYYYLKKIRYVKSLKFFLPVKVSYVLLDTKITFVKSCDVVEHFFYYKTVRCVLEYDSSVVFDKGVESPYYIPPYPIYVEKDNFTYQIIL